ncbi:cell division control protein 14, SIN component-domain-containing protein [Crucibulum laeve]|uniref:Cell division control protein 14, SIN component-domain-containing protein n=1 Tax=Crucibulum laeve TaxID=68775 RepID=A0A5C3MEL1_9AGAR|nr:cell division control protein 14, SIN component-domain-containing protein [Crucibulum laeve]
MEATMMTMRDNLQNALDELSLPRSSNESKAQALETLERHLAVACMSKDGSEEKDVFLALQYTFECNVPSRLLAWIGPSTLKLEQLTNKGVMDDMQESEAFKLSSQLAVALSLIQGVTLIHDASKRYLGRKASLEVLLDLLLASRHLSVPAESSTPGSSRKLSTAPLPLSSTVLDTLLCILVDSPGALRVFEDANGTQAVVKILKRAGTPREVRMKCLEFLYFYLLDETPSSSIELPRKNSQSTPPPTVPATPIKPSKPYLNGTPLRPSSKNFPFSSSASSSGSSSSSRSASGSSTKSYSSTSSNASSSTTASSVSSSPEKASPMPRYPPKTPPSSPPLAHRVPLQLHPRSMMMLKEVDYVPLSPKKAQVSQLGVGGISRRAPSKGLSRLGSCESVEDQDKNQMSYSEVEKQEEPPEIPQTNEKRRTTEEKKQLLGTMLGNVDALVEGVRKAGIWGLG